jgi:peptidoglycan/LPS O-acetylase OafA/YrhL
MTARETSLDGLRGWAAIAVCLYHFVWELFGARFPELRSLVVGVFCNGRLAVSVFFVLTGYVLTVGSWGGDKGGIRRQLLKRYFRLTIPIGFAVIFTMLLIEAGLSRDMLAAGDAIRRPEWLGTFLLFDPTWAGAAMFATVLTYWFVPFHLSYNAFLWTMPYELLGSYLVLLVCLAERWLRLPLALAILVTFSALMLLVGSYFALGACFSIGAFLAAVQRGERSSSWWLILIAICAVVMGAWIQLMAWPMWGTSLCAAVVVACVVSSTRLSAALSTPLGRYLGRLSYPIYLMQFPVLISLSSTLIVGAEAFLDLKTALAISIVSVAAVIVAALPFGWVERLTAKVGKSLDWLISRRHVERSGQHFVRPMPDAKP